jgi:hypothetical protein
MMPCHLTRSREHGDRDAAHKLVTSHLGLVAKVEFYRKDPRAWRSVLVLWAWATSERCYFCLEWCERRECELPRNQ